MNMKKIIASALTFVMAMSTIASAATTKADVANRAPVWTMEEPVKLTTEDEVKAASTAKYAKDYDDTAYDYYKLVYKLTNLGELKNADWKDIIGIGALSLGMKTKDIVSGGIASTGLSTLTTAFGNDIADPEYFKLTWAAAGGTANPYPACDYDDTGAQLESADGTLTFTTAIAVNKGATLSISDFKAKIDYVTDNEVITSVTDSVTLPTAFTIGQTVEEDKPVIFTADLKEDTANGYIWALTFTQSADKLASFTAKFEADGVKPAERVMQDVSTVASVLGGKLAPIVLNVGLETTKTLTAATFTADDAVEATPAKVVEAPLSK